MSSTMKGLLLKSNTNDIYMRKLLKQKYAHQQFQSNYPSSIHVNCSTWSKVIRCHQQEANGFSNSPTPIRKQNLPAAQASLSLVSDPTSTAKKLGGKGGNLAEMASLASLYQRKHARSIKLPKSFHKDCGKRY